MRVSSMMRRACSRDCLLAGGKGAAGMPLILMLIGLLSAGVAVAAAGDDLVELSFPLPAGGSQLTGVALQDGGLTVRLPPGGGVPNDILAAGKGLVASGQLHHEPDGSLRYEIVFNSAGLDQVLVLPEYLVLKIRRLQPGLTPAGSVKTYRLGVGDKIRISVEGQQDLFSDVVVNSNGLISAPLVGEVTAAGRTVQEVSEEVARLLAADFLVNPRVDVQVEEYNSQWVLVTGQVMRPGRVSLRGGTTLKEIIAEAGGFTLIVGQQIRVVFNPEAGAGGRESEVVNRLEFEAGLTHTVPKHGSIIHVEKVAYAFIQGEIISSGKVELEPGMTLLKAIAIKGGLTEWANRKEIRILDGADGGKAKVYNLKKIQAQKVPDPVLEEGQMIIVPRRFL